MFRSHLYNLLAVGTLIGACVSQASAAKRVTVEQFEQAVAAMRAKPDLEAAQRLAEMELTERLSDARLARLKAELPGIQAQQELLAIADASAFSDLPSADLIAAPSGASVSPDSIRLQAMEYVSKTLPKLPNFFATEKTTSFADLPSYTREGQAIPAQYVPIRQVGNSTVTVLYRDGHELIDTGPDGKKLKLPARELSTQGEFGPILATVLADASRGEVTWGHWEQGESGPVAVVRYKVGQPASHYTVSFAGIDRDLQIVPGYHGEIAVNPDDGAIVRLTMVADLKPSDPGSEANMLVEYGRVEIGGKPYMCPVKSVAISVVHMLHREATFQGSTKVSYGPMQMRVNDVQFTNYHLFRAEVRILSGDDSTDGGVTPATGQGDPATPPTAAPKP
jgi:hypothetical protein